MREVVSSITLLELIKGYAVIYPRRFLKVTAVRNLNLKKYFNSWHVYHTVTGISIVWKYWQSEWRSRVSVFPKYYKSFVLAKLCKLRGYLLLDKYVTWKHVCSNQQSKHNCKLHLHFVVFQHVSTYEWMNEWLSMETSQKMWVENIKVYIHINLRIQMHCYNT